MGTRHLRLWHDFDAARYMGPFNRRTANPVLVVGTFFDPATPYRAPRLSRPAAELGAANVTPGGTRPPSVGCADEATARYLSTASCRPPGTVCEQDVVPFSGP